MSVTTPAIAMDRVRDVTSTEEAIEIFGVTGQGVIVAILDRGIDWRSPDFIRPDGTTRILAMLDMTGQDSCGTGPMPVEYSSAQINAALAGGPSIPFRDAIGHGTCTAGIAVGSGRAFADAKYRGIAPGADLIVVKLVSEGAPAHDGQPAEAAFQGCHEQALDWLDAKIDEFDRPCVAILNSGTQWGPIDGTSVVSRKLQEVFGGDRPGRILVLPSGDEGGLPTHASGPFDTEGTTVNFVKSTAATAYLSMYYTGAAPAAITVSTASGAILSDVLPGTFRTSGPLSVVNYQPGTEFYPWTSNSGDRAVWIQIGGIVGNGTVTIRALSTPPSSARFDLWNGQIPNTVRFMNHLTPGRLTDFASTTGAIVVGASVARNSYTDINGVTRDVSFQGSEGELWERSSEGPTRDARQGLTVVAPGHNVFCSYGADSYYHTFTSRLIQDGGGSYGWFAATSGAASIVVGAVALMLEARPDLTGDEITAILTTTSSVDAETGGVPNTHWGYGRLNVLRAVRAAFCCTGDATDDLTVDVDDLNAILSNWQVNVGVGSPLDLANNDGVVDVDDLNVVLGAWGAECRG